MNLNLNSTQARLLRASLDSLITRYELAMLELHDGDYGRDRVAGWLMEAKDTRDKLIDLIVRDGKPKKRRDTRITGVTQYRNLVFKPDAVMQLHQRAIEAAQELVDGKPKTVKKLKSTRVASDTWYRPKHRTDTPNTQVDETEFAAGPDGHVYPKSLIDEFEHWRLYIKLPQELAKPPLDGDDGRIIITKPHHTGGGMAAQIESIMVDEATNLMTADQRARLEAIRSSLDAGDAAKRNNERRETHGLPPLDGDKATG